MIEVLVNRLRDSSAERRTNQGLRNVDHCLKCSGLNADNFDASEELLFVCDNYPGQVAFICQFYLDNGLFFVSR